MIASYLYFPHAVAVVYTAVFLSVAVHFRAHLSSPALDAFSLLDSVMNMCKNKVGGKLLPRYGLVSAVTQALFSLWGELKLDLVILNVQITRPSK